MGRVILINSVRCLKETKLCRQICGFPKQFLLSLCFVSFAVSQFFDHRLTSSHTTRINLPSPPSSKTCFYSPIPPSAPRGRSSAVDAPSMVLITRNERVTSTNNRVDTTIPNVDGAAVLETWQFKVLDYLFSIPIFNDALFGVYRKQQVKKAEGMGIKWTAFLDDLNRNKDRLL